MINVLLTGAGGGACVGVIKSLRKTKKPYKIVVTDSDKLSAGFSLADKSYVVPKSEDREKFIKKIFKIIKKEKIDVILPTSGFDIEALSVFKKDIEDMGVKILMNDYGVVMTCHDKWFCKKFLKEFGCTPLEGKYKRFRFEKEKRQETFKEEYLPGKEYSIDSLSDMNGKFIMAIPRIRIKTIGSYSWKGRIVMNRKIIKICKDISNKLNLKGVNCIQLKEDKNGQPKLLEINPRFGGSTYFSTLAGANLAQMIIDIGFDKKINIPKIKPITILRYFEEVIYENN